MVIDEDEGDLKDKEEKEVEQGAQLDEQVTIAQSSEQTEGVEEAEVELVETFVFLTSLTQTPLSPKPISMQPLLIPERTTSVSSPSTSGSNQIANQEVIPMLSPVGSPTHTPFLLEGPPQKSPTIEEIHTEQPQPPQKPQAQTQPNPNAKFLEVSRMGERSLQHLGQLRRLTQLLSSLYYLRRC